MTKHATPPQEALDLTPLAGRIGAEIRGLSLAPGLDATILRALRDALTRYKVLFFRAQHHVDGTVQQDFSRAWGEPVGHPTAPGQKDEYLLELSAAHGGKANVWHTDMTFLSDYPSVSILRAVDIPPVGGDTVWANTASAYAHLPPALRRLADELWAVHSNDYDYSVNQTGSDQAVDAYHAAFVSSIFEAEHPLVRLHPLSGEKSLVLGGFFKKFSGLSQTESRHLFDIFQAHVTRLENTVRWRWNRGDVVIWDNQSTQHYAIDDYGDYPRVVQRMTLRGGPATAVDGRRSRQILPATNPAGHATGNAD
ncbi:TauD/TfdA dioxygenase family protein [Gluconacetobacter takamatsuzukensis]|uniref:TauD/TfdA family dioxygenase n=1 Tax=Gluconacetobacter takamatsuzukensis TaxID=1286190 RepID=A0A7W4PPU1_9PROT|nr:TauD/TfdA family dioxygenase [Gluconacetobacter takamatsuzukensis]MBB2205795.1 TauD/TfdA family dioxygenase [Gluconacetobacter takamatsuzukensis]